MADRSLSPRNRFAKRHYEAIAQALQDAQRHIAITQGLKDAKLLRCNGSEQMECVVNCLADLFAGDNGQFRRERFKRACEVGANVRARS
jgi:hypothetical protein